MHLLQLILLILALILLILAALDIPVRRISLIAAGLFFAVLAFAIPVFA
jgi:hypothetical protein